MGVVLIAVALVAGYLFSSKHLSSKYQLNRTDGWHSYFYVAYRGVIFSLVSGAVCFSIDYFDCVSKFIKPLGFLLTDFEGLFLNFSEIKIGAWALLTIFLAQVSAWFSLLYYRLFLTQKTKRLRKIISNNHLESFIFESTYDQKLIMLTLSSKKTYVGKCLGDELIDGKVEHIAILPHLSGYRNKDTLVFEHTTNYLNHYADQGIYDGSHNFLKLRDFRVIIPCSEIESYSFFDMSTYIKFRQDENKKKQSKLSNNTYPSASISALNIKNPTV
ncbi:hypothetical protein A6E05_05680 [Aliivibrio sp. 1S165]|uniref:hypothetical protein n=1 Tax=unclassified Aliivibrio TaxID=2645654 RepID=UPI00080D91CF|nr:MULTISPECIES: hypothetical protein [unclassified Aliivibrio]OCH13797.1 hypothetical protein A6E05_05680 [Aliivibrio sp. 1S165]OCH31562.1 hypothetical protein A6E06_02760 [Aliivibrio sp. 1S175]